MSWIFSVFYAVLLLTLCERIARHFQIRKFKREHGCQPLVQVPQSERILGWNLYRSQVKADREHRVLEAGRERYLKFGNTFSLNLMGLRFINV